MIGFSQPICLQVRLPSNPSHSLHYFEAHLSFSIKVVDNSSEKFTWGTPDVENLVPFCAQHIGWSKEETIKVLDPVTKRAKTGYHQTRIDSFMRYEDSIKFANVRSKRLRKVLGLDDDENETHSELPSTDDLK